MINWQIIPSLHIATALHCYLSLQSSTIFEDNGVFCKVLASLNKLALLAVWSWMLAESVFLYRLIARAFSRNSGIKWYLLAAWGTRFIVG